MKGSLVTTAARVPAHLPGEAARAVVTGRR
ncbi:MAG: hypothetical protein K0Q92_1696 [Steroidobacteraceae bacterium]|jgi:hypothetical protein|nr:hypothetical protein [Steroidobacteraceae bacterium]